MENINIMKNNKKPIADRRLKIISKSLILETLTIFLSFSFLLQGSICFKNKKPPTLCKVEHKQCGNGR
jgi:hypothetical protein